MAFNYYNLFFKWLFAGFALTSQLVLLVNFSIRRWKPQLEIRWGGLMYAMLGVPAFFLGVLLFLARQPWLFVGALLSFAAWAAFGYVVDVRKKISWRSPPRWSVLIPYVILYVGSLLSLWVATWYVHVGAWIAFAVLYTVSSILNISSHGRKYAAAAG